MTDSEILAVLNISGVRESYVKRAFRFFKGLGPGHADDFYNKIDRREFREEHMSLEVLKIYLRTLDEPVIALRVLDIWNNNPMIDERLKGDFHTHTEFSDGMNTTEEMLAKAVSLGYSWITLSDHAPVPGNSYTLTVDKYLERTRIAKEFAKHNKIRVYNSIEANILKDGNLDIPPEISYVLDFAIASLHKTYGDSEAEILKRIERALKDSRVIGLAHPFFAVKPNRGFASSLIELIEDSGKAVELNLFPGYFKGNLFLLDELLKEKNGEVKVILSTDAHCVGGLSRMRFGNFFLEKLGEERVLNTLNEPIHAFKLYS